jgi:hypothetical protein
MPELCRLNEIFCHIKIESDCACAIISAEWNMFARGRVTEGRRELCN